ARFCDAPSPMMEATLMIEPPLPSASWRLATSRQHQKRPLRFTLIVCSQSSSGVRSGNTPASAATPALFTRMSTRPKRFHAASTPTSPGATTVSVPTTVPVADPAACSLASSDEVAVVTEITGLVPLPSQGPGYLLCEYVDQATPVASFRIVTAGADPNPPAE